MDWITHRSSSAFETDAVFSRVVEGEEFIFIAGTTGFNYDTMTLPEGAYEQARATWENVGKALAQAGSSLDEVVNYTMVLTDADDLPEINRAMHDVLTTRPAGMCIVSGLVDPRLRYEVQVTAAKGARLRSAHTATPSV